MSKTKKRKGQKGTAFTRMLSDERNGNKPQKRVMQRMTVGIHTGKRIDQLPVGYLQWMVDKPWDDEDVLAQAKEALARKTDSRKEQTKDGVLVTEELMELGRTKAGGWTARKLKILGVAWPPQKGWKKRLIGTRIPYEQAMAFTDGRFKGKAESKPVQRVLIQEDEEEVSELDLEYRAIMGMPTPAAKPEKPKRRKSGITTLGPPYNFTKHPVPSDVILDPNEECPF